MGATSGSTYVASFGPNVIQPVAQDLIQVYPSTNDNHNLIIHSWRLTVQPLDKSGVSQDDRMNLQVVRRSTLSTTGGAVGFLGTQFITPTPLQPKSGTAVTNVETNLNVLGTLGSVIESDTVSVMYPWSRTYREDQRIPIVADDGVTYPSLPVCLYLATPPSTWYLMSGEVVFEELSV